MEIHKHLTGKFITFEGIDFSGKSVQAELLTKRLDSTGKVVQLFREPGGTEISEKIRDILLDRRWDAMSHITEMLLYSAARAQLVEEKILPALKQGHIVICDRFYDSTTAYQGYGRGIDIDVIERIHAIATAGVVPDVTFVLDLPPEIALSRQANVQHSNSLKSPENRDQSSGMGREGELDRLELQGLEFYQRVRQGYLLLAKQHPQRMHVIDATQTIETIHQKIWKIITQIL